MTRTQRDSPATTVCPPSNHSYCSSGSAPPQRQGQSLGGHKLSGQTTGSNGCHEDCHTVIDTYSCLLPQSTQPADRASPSPPIQDLVSTPCKVNYHPTPLFCVCLLFAHCSTVTTLAISQVPPSGSLERPQCQTPATLSVPDQSEAGAQICTQR